MRTLTAIVLIALVVSVPVLADGDPYKAILERIEQADPEVDFTAFRELWTEQENYKPYLHSSTAYKDTIEKLEGHLAAGEYDKACTICGETGDRYLIDLKWNLRCAEAFGGKGDEDRQRIHDNLVHGLIKSIMDSGDGASMETAYKVVTFLEQHAVFAVLEVAKGGQSLHSKNGRQYDKITVHDRETGETRELWFDVTAFFGWMEEKR